MQSTLTLLCKYALVLNWCIFGFFINTIGDFFIAIAFNAIFAWSVEIFPLRIRSEGMCFLQVISHSGSVTAPWIVKGLKRYGYWCPFFTLGFPALIGSLIGLWLPETRNTSLDREDSEMKIETSHQDVIKNENAC